MIPMIKAPFPWFGGKSRVSKLVWQRFGDTVNYVEPFAGSLAVLLGRPYESRNETVNDIDCHISNFWRAITKDPQGVADYAEWPVNEADLHARHEWLRKQEEFREKMHSDPNHYDIKIAGWWVWGISAWIGDNWCRTSKQRGLPSLKNRSGIHSLPKDGTGLDRRRPSIGNGSKGIHKCYRKRQQVKKGGVGINRNDLSKPSRQIPNISGDSGATGRGINAKYAEGLHDYFERLFIRLERVRVCCGEWHRILGPSPTIHIGVTAVFLDPPYGVEDRDKVYNHDGIEISKAVNQWCMWRGDDKKLRIALCGYEGEHNNLEERGWKKIAWKAGGGYGNRGTRGQENRNRERIWFSPHCLSLEGTLFEE